MLKVCRGKRSLIKQQNIIKFNIFFVFTIFFIVWDLIQNVIIKVDLNSSTYTSLFLLFIISFDEFNNNR